MNKKYIFSSILFFSTTIVYGMNTEISSPTISRSTLVLPTCFDQSTTDYLKHIINESINIGTEVEGNSQKNNGMLTMLQKIQRIVHTSNTLALDNFMRDNQLIVALQNKAENNTICSSCLKTCIEATETMTKLWNEYRRLTAYAFQEVMQEANKNIQWPEHIKGESHDDYARRLFIANENLDPNDQNTNDYFAGILALIALRQLERTTIKERCPVIRDQQK